MNCTFSSFDGIENQFKYGYGTVSTSPEFDVLFQSMVDVMKDFFSKPQDWKLQWSGRNDFRTPIELGYSNHPNYEQFQVRLGGHGMRWPTQPSNLHDICTRMFTHLDQKLRHILNKLICKCPANVQHGIQSLLDPPLNELLEDDSMFTTNVLKVLSYHQNGQIELDHPHFDSTLVNISISKQDGLQFFDYGKKKWVNAPTGKMITLVGNGLSIRSKKMYPSAYHRVVNFPGEPRLAIVFFLCQSINSHLPLQKVENHLDSKNNGINKFNQSSNCIIL